MVEYCLPATLASWLCVHNSAWELGIYWPYAAGTMKPQLVQMSQGMSVCALRSLASRNNTCLCTLTTLHFRT